MNGRRVSCQWADGQMSEQVNLWQSTAITASGIRRASAAGKAVQSRGKILEQTQLAENAVMRPKDTGAWPRALRAALAARIAKIHGDLLLQSIYLNGYENDRLAVLSEPAHDGSALGLAPVIVFMDRVAAEPREIEAGDIQILLDAGIGDADIVRLCELNAFLSYQIRVVAGLRLLAREMA